MGVTQIDAQPGEGDRYTARGSYFTLPGRWRVTVIARRPRFSDILTSFDLVVAGSLPANPAVDALINPIPAGAESIAQGQTLYVPNCVPCHGVSGKGDGPVGLTLNPRPADLTLHAVPGVHTDGQLYDWITNGYPASPMPAFGDYLSDEDRWNLVNYIRTLAPIDTR
jgi:mono/diheme cytochrome c family protein